jgi:predicted phosphodiesterase
MSVNAVLSDIHGNIQALEAVLDQAVELGCKKIYVLGDIVGYGANPNECIDLLRSWNAQALLGNHDAAVAGLDGDDCFNFAAREGVAYCRKVLTNENMAWLRNLPGQLRPCPDVLMVHGSPWDRDEYLSGPWAPTVAADRLMAQEGSGLCFFGHTHLPVIARSRSGRPDVRVMVNPGSVGQPRDRCHDASFAVWEDAEDSVDIVRVGYDIEGAQGAIVDAGLPRWLGERLGVGG